MSGNYTPQQLQAMAQQALRARDAGDPRWNHLLLSLMLRVWSFVQAELRIEALARGEVPA